MTEQRFVVFEDGVSKHIEDTNYTEDKHDHNLYDAYEMCDKLNQQYEENKQLKELIKIADGLIEWNTVPQIRREWEKQKKGDVE